MPVRNGFPHEMVGSGYKTTGLQDSSLSNAMQTSLVPKYVLISKVSSFQAGLELSSLFKSPDNFLSVALVSGWEGGVF